MAYRVGGAKRVWTGELPAGVEAGSSGDSRICWHVRFTWNAGPELQEAIREAWGDDLPLHMLPDDRRRQMAEGLLKVVVGWENVVGDDGNPVECTPEAIMEIDPAHIVALVTSLAVLSEQIDRDVVAKKAP